MKYRESGTPEEEMWESFFNPREVLINMKVNKNIRSLIDIGCGYGTFLFPASDLVSDKVIGIDIDEKMIGICNEKVLESRVSNIHLINGDISKEDTIKRIQKHKSSIDYITLFNILHCEKPIDLLKDVYNILSEGGMIGIIHWKYADTPRGPSMEIRPKPSDIIGWAKEVGFSLIDEIEILPYHFGLVFSK